MPPMPPKSDVAPFPKSDGLHGFPTEVGQDPTPFAYPSWVPQLQVLVQDTGYLSWFSP